MEAERFAFIPRHQPIIIVHAAETRAGLTASLYLI
jgi:hypothetical protein